MAWRKYLGEEEEEEERKMKIRGEERELTRETKQGRWPMRGDKMNLCSC